MPNPPLPKTLWKLFVILMTSEYVNLLLFLLANVSFAVGVLCGRGRSVHQKNKDVTVLKKNLHISSNVKEQQHSIDDKFYYLRSLVKIPFTVFDLFFLSTRKRTNTAMTMAAEAMTDATMGTETLFLSNFLLRPET